MSRAKMSRGSSRRSASSKPTAAAIEDYTKTFIKKNQSEYNEKQLADMLGITRKSLWEKRKKWGIPRER